MCLGRRVADHEPPIRSIPRRTDAWLNRSNAKPRAFTPSPCKGIAQRARAGAQVTFERFARSLSGCGGPAGFEGITANAARKRELTVLGNDEAAIAARK